MYPPGPAKALDGRLVFGILGGGPDGQATASIRDAPQTPVGSILVEGDKYILDADGNPVPETGSRTGNTTGTFFHLIAEASS